MFFCKDCDGLRVKDKQIAIYGSNEEAAEYALGMLLYSSQVAIVTNGQRPDWSRRHGRWLREYQIPVYREAIVKAVCSGCQIKSLQFAGGAALKVQALFTTRGDVYYNQLARMLGAKIRGGEIAVDFCLRTSIKGLYAAGCVTPANCQMIIAAGQGATAAQSINRELFKANLAGHALRRCRGLQPG
jgi:thioredoxin reductase (NADPH)